MKTTIEQIRELATPYIKSYVTDLDHDERNLKTYKGRFLLYVNENGTHMNTLPDAKDFPDIGELVKYLFGEVDREHLLNEKMNIHRAIAGQGERYSKLILYYDGLALHEVNLSKAEEIISTYQETIKNEWS